MDVYEAVRKSNIDVGAKVLEKNGIEFFIRGVGFIKSVEDLEKVVIRQEKGTPIQVKHVATVQLGPEFRRGALDKAGVEAVGGVVLMRYGENPLHVVERVKEKIKQLEPGLPQKTLADGRVSKVKIVSFYDRTDIVKETIDTLKEALLEEVLMASAVILIFLLHLRSTISVIVTLPLSVALCFILMYVFGVDANIMSLAGLAIAIGDVGDMGIIMTENIYRHVATGDRSEEPLSKGLRGRLRSRRRDRHRRLEHAGFVHPGVLPHRPGREALPPAGIHEDLRHRRSVMLALTVVPLLCYLLFRPVTWSRRTVWIIAAALGLAAVFAAHAVLMWAIADGHYSGWPMSAVVGVIVALAFVRMTRERFLPLEENPVSRGIARVYVPILRWILAHKKTFLIVPVTILFTGLTIWLGIGTTLAPVGWAINLFASEQASPELKQAMYLKTTDAVTRPLVELDQLRWQRVKHADGSTSPAHRMAAAGSRASATPRRHAASKSCRSAESCRASAASSCRRSMKARSSTCRRCCRKPASAPRCEVNARQDLAIASVPEVESVVGKLGRAESALDPAPIGMIESIIILKPESEWRHIPVKRWFSDWPGWLKNSRWRWIWPEHRRITKNEILGELQEKTAIPGVLPTFLQPIQTRLVMLQTGFRAMMGVKIYGSDLKEIERIGLQIEQLLKQVPGATDIVADRIVGKPYLEFEIDRDRIARYGVNIRDVQDVIEIAIGGMNIMESVEGRERYPIRVRYLREFREDIPELEKILVPSSSGAQIPLAQVLTIKSVLGPQEIKGERGLLVGYVTMNTRDRDEVSVVEDAEAVLQAAVRDGRLKLPPGYYWEWSGQFENQVRATKRMSILVPVCLFIMFVMLYLGFKRWWIAPIIFFGILVAAAGRIHHAGAVGREPLRRRVGRFPRAVRRGRRRRRGHLDLPRRASSTRRHSTPCRTFAELSCKRA